MYERHFGFAEKPFNLTPDSRYLFLSPKHQEAYANLEFGVRERSGFLLLTGEVGTGKTTLIRHFLSQVGPDVRTAVILYPAVSAGELFHGILEDLGVPFGGGTLKDAVDTLSKALIAAKALNLKVVVLIDEAQNLKPQVLEQLRLLSNLETEREKLLTLVLVGQPELRDLLDRPSLRQLSQRITSRSHLDPLSAEETQLYVKHRLSVAGGTGSEIETAAARRVHTLSGGVPRVVNVICDRALVGAFGRGQKTVDEKLLNAAAAEVLPSSATSSWAGGRFAEALGLFALGLLLMLGLRYCASPGTTGKAPAPTSSSIPAATQAPAGPDTPVLDLSQAAGGSAQGVRCQSVPDSRTAAISAVEVFLGTPGFDSARATLTFEQWRALNLPAIARVQGASGPCDVALRPAEAATTRVSDDTGDYAMDDDRLRDLYLGTAIICFVDRDSVLAKPERARLTWARRVLERRSLLARGSTDQALNAALTRLGSRVGLTGAPSVEGALLAALYSVDGSGGARRSGEEP